MPVGARSHSFDMSNSQVPRVLLQVNPGLDRQLERHLSLMDHLDKKRQRTWMSEKHNFRDSFHNRMDKRRRIYQRQRMKMDLAETRKVVDAIKADRVQASLRRGSPSINQSQKRSKKTIEGDSCHDTAGRAWTPASALESMTKNWEQASPSQMPAMITADETDMDPVPFVPLPGQSSALSSRRSSLKSSIMELDPVGRAETPGPAHSNDPLAALAPKPGVIVTQPLDKDRSPSPLPAEDVTKLKAPDEKIWNLLPAPTPTRFVGKMHAVLTTPRRKSKSAEAPQESLATGSMGEVMVPATTERRESEELDQVGELLHSSSKDPSSPSRSTFGHDSDDEEIIKKTEGIKKYSNSSSRSMEQGPGVTTSARFLSKVKGRKIGSTDVNNDKMGEVGGKISSALSKRNAWKSTIQASKEDAQSVKGSARFSLKRMTSTLSTNQTPSGGGWKKFNPTLAVGAASLAFGNRGHASKPSRLSESLKATNRTDGSRTIGKTRVQLFRKSSTNVLQGFGIAQLSNVDKESLNVPGMKRGFSLIEKKEGGFDSGISHPPWVPPTNNDSEPAEGTSAKDENIFKSGQVLAKTGFLRKKAETRLQESSEQTRAGSPDASLGSITSLVKGIPTTSKLVSKLHSMRAQQDGEMGDPDDKWDWMTGVPTSIRFLVKSWKTIDRGPGGIITDAPNKLTQARDVPDFSATVNMLTVLAKADMKLKAQSRDDREEEDSQEVEKRRGSRRKSSIRRPSYVGITPRGDEVPNKPVQRDSLATRPLSRDSSLRTDSDPLTQEASESDAFLTQLLGPLRLVETDTISKWNVDKTIQEETGGQPFFMKLEDYD